jgi:murE/murF fusion protein
MMTVTHREHSIVSLLSGVTCTGMMNTDAQVSSAVRVDGITSDSREVRPGFLFVALEGFGVDGHSFINSAIGCGARVVLGVTGRLQDVSRAYPEVVFVEVENSHKAYASIAANYFNQPASKLTLAAVTGTNGKTTVTYIVEDILKEAGKSVGVIGTVNNRYTTADGVTTVLPTRFTTPEPFVMQKLLAEMVDAGIENVVMEVSSHALAQARVGTLKFKAAAFTNLSRDHLDYHRSMADYFQAKMLLFRQHLEVGATAVIPVIPHEGEVAEMVKQLHENCLDLGLDVIRWGATEAADIRLLSHHSALEETILHLDMCGNTVSVSTRLVGYYNIENIMTAMGLCRALGVADEEMCSAVARTAGAPGRLQRILASSWGNAGPTVFVDYAHTPDALEKVLTTVKELPHKELYGVFGCGGDRDRGKRPLMGAIGAAICDVSIVTDDNPRTEDPDYIVGQVLEGARSADSLIRPFDWLMNRAENESGCVVIRDRHKAIETAIRTATAGDIVVIAGKGHEPYQLTIKGKKYFDDSMQAKDALFSWTVSHILNAVSGTCFSGVKSDCLLGPVVTDSRLKTAKGIFVALKGDNHDAHDYASQAASNGAQCLILDHPVLDENSEITQIIVADTLKALGDLAGYRRKKVVSESHLKVIGLTGSCGKTTVKEMIAAILRRKYPSGEDFPENCVLKTEGNFNNLIGLPLSLLPLSVNHRAAVLEMGMNVPGEIKRLAEIADPDISCITNIHGAHLLGLHSIEGVADAKEELFQATKETGILIVNLDDTRVAQRSEKYRQKKITFGVRCLVDRLVPDVWASDIRLLDAGALTFTLHWHDLEKEIHLYIAGEHNVVNALCATATAIAAGCSIDEIALGLADFRAPDKRMQLVASRFGFQILNDTYNANPSSMEAGLRALVQIGSGKKIAVIGDMLELGNDSAKAHYQIGKCVADLGLDFVIFCGEWGEEIVKGMTENGGAKNSILSVKDKSEVEEYLHDLVAEKQLGEGDLVLFKASRGLRFETMVDTFKQ